MALNQSLQPMEIAKTKSKEFDTTLSSTKKKIAPTVLTHGAKSTFLKYMYILIHVPYSQFSHRIKLSRISHTFLLSRINFLNVKKTKPHVTNSVIARVVLLIITNGLGLSLERTTWRV